MTRQLFIYYRIPKANIALGLACAEKLLAMLGEQGFASGELFQREEVDKPYFTLMEIITPTPAHLEHIKELTSKVEQLATVCFSALPVPPSRHVEVFSKLSRKG